MSGFFCPKWCEEWVVLYEDSTLAWYSDKGLNRPKGCVRISDAPELLAVGEWTRQVPRRPKFPHACHMGQLLAIGSRKLHDVHWLMAKSPAEINDWMTAISNTLPPPPHLPLNDKRLSLTPQQKQDIVVSKQCQCNGVSSIANGNSIQQQTINSPLQKNYEADHTVLAGVCIDWGHGWGWGQNANWGPQALFGHEETLTVSQILPAASISYCHSAEDYTVSGMDEVDWCAFGDFSF
ncbi:uncharacterized protein LOC114332169 [Diabrotica virgifera virgifera]|uniref:PH domain-containing protein n=1 Tax=Diabrotica virgifera virgifera TaxID=50390 RepID=A0ABM5KY70_DIAVI|nr:uncharacterized protein LOC114332169 [Diabrotica virgifera virgifera]